MMSTFATASLRAASHAPVASEDSSSRNRSRITAQITLTSSAPTATPVSPSGDGGSWLTIFTTTITIAATAGIRISPASTAPTLRRRSGGHATAKKTSRLIAVSSRKSAESANSDVEPIAIAAANSTKKYAKFSSATISTARRIR